ncbi:MAG: hypothetical protein DIZ80_03865 [endosymbiont of Galathealinum brachiosum]|uniref:DOMON domain-containing protein n=1 Tax=endosymbiont of Galathealinum brachiosum TaxID=2200906 RepID=A0A370DI65_9GAMM|nr:MAG: hypothetical protein DIZ80_03865 [endosymbiont of Galathealinum brachiosum]
MNISRKIAIALCVVPLSLSVNTSYSASCSPGGYANSFSSGTGFEISWDVCAGNLLQMEISNTSTGWIGIGFSFDQLMANTDVFLGGFDGGAYGYDGFAFDGFSGPPVDASQDFTIESSTEVGGTTTMELSRLLSTGDINDFDLSIGEYYLLWAFGGLDDFAFHGVGDGRGFSAETYSFAAVPVPPALPLMLFGLGFFGFMGFHNRK